jgi:glycosyltransferase involved in cell wall biosynthesis
LRICIVSQYFWPESFRINDLVQGLAGRGHSVQVLTGQPNYPTGVVDPEYRSLTPKRSHVLGCDVLRVPLVARGKGSGARLAVNYASFASSASIFGLRGIKKPVDAVLAYEPSPVTVAVPALILGRQFDAPTLMWVQDLWPETLRATGAVSDGWAFRAAARVTRRLHTAMDGLLVQSEGFIDPLIGQGVTPAKITYLPNWAEDYFRPISVPDTAPERKEIPNGFVVMFAGNIGVSQGLEVLLGAAEQLRDAGDIHWVVLGEGRQASWLRDEVNKRKLRNVHLLGQRPQKSMPLWFALADALLVTLRPDPVYQLTIPSKVQAYLACGRPILASLDGAGASEVERAGAGLATPAGDADALAAAVLSLYRLPGAERVAMGLRGRAYSERNFQREALIDRLEAVLAEAVSTRSLARSTA